MKKTDKKTEKALIAALHKVCNDALDKVEGFEWLTHLGSFSDFPNSLRIVCVFKSNDSLEQARKKKSRPLALRMYPAAAWRH